jgi:hypothetical protein
MNRTGNAVVMLGLLVLSLSCHAQIRPALSLVTDGIDSDANACGVTQSAIESITGLTLRNNGIEFVLRRPEAGGAYLYVNFNVIQMPVGGTRVCVMSLGVRVQQHSLEQLAPPFKSRRPTSVLLCDKASIFYMPSHVAASRAAANLENQIKQCLGDLDY